ncbi:hypothetical protein [Mucilaginibacter flavidus]|uniref:hypothetical protein n=1 Tax=Mucilaginibacter flavidus TaxID=2949309 RepID=UPI00209378EB|nr:hypothetical protein [Mucilaginibacter flavidus]MCO5949741.1 hypothetical protein [Mucilaginibacter flavidus]
MLEIQGCKIKAEEHAERDSGAAGKKLVLFSSDSKGFKLVDDDEIIANGKMYDIVKTRTSNGITSYYARADADEDEYVSKLTEIEKGNAAEKSSPGKTIKLYEAKYFAAKKNLYPDCFSLDLPPGAITLENTLLYNALFKDIYAPPPDYLAS